MAEILDLTHRKLWGYVQKYNLQCMLMVVLVAIEMEPAARLATSATKFELCSSSAWCYHFRKKKSTFLFISHSIGSHRVISAWHSHRLWKDWGSVHTDVI